MGGRFALLRYLLYSSACESLHSDCCEPIVSRVKKTNDVSASNSTLGDLEIVTHLALSRLIQDAIFSRAKSKSQLSDFEVVGANRFIAVTCTVTLVWVDFLCVVLYPSTQLLLDDPCPSSQYPVHVGRRNKRNTLCWSDAVSLVGNITVGDSTLTSS